MEHDEFGNKEDVDRDYMLLVLDNLRVAIREQLDTVHIGYFMEEDGIKFYDVAREDWPRLLDIILTNGVALEEYELCAEFQKLKWELNGEKC